VAGRPIIDYLFSQAVVLPGVEDITLVTNSLYKNRFKAWLASSYPDLEIKLIDDGARTPEQRLGAIGDLQLCLNSVGTETDILVLPSDTLVGIQLDNFWQRFLTVQTTLNAIFDIGDVQKVAGKLGSVKTLSSRITAFEEKPKIPTSTLVSVPLYAYPKSVLPMIKTYIDEKQPTDAPGSFLHWLLTKQTVEAYMIDTFYYDVGTIKAYNDAQSRFFKS
jgi:glucose-1-phosphate thymidylyltransferase